MVNRKNLETKYALISVYDKSKLNLLCNNLKKYNYKFISTGSTCKKIKSLGFECIEISKITKSKEILNGRVKTLNPKVYGSILHKKNDKKHVEEFLKLNFPNINLVVINLYPFEKISKKNDHDLAIEMIDIGGPSLIRASSKNYKFITIISKIEDYKNLVNNLKFNNGNTDIVFRKKMAAKAFKLTHEYDLSISNWFNSKNIKTHTKLKYGENPHQRSFIQENSQKSIFELQISGKPISYNNIIDVDSGIKCLNEFSEPTCVIVKHSNPCGVASSNNIENAYKKAYQSDSKSAFGGILFINKTVKIKLAKLISKNFYEMIVAKNFDKNATEILSKKKKLILLKMDKIKMPKNEYRSTIFGTIHQNRLSPSDNNLTHQKQSQPA